MGQAKTLTPYRKKQIEEIAIENERMKKCVQQAKSSLNKNKIHQEWYSNVEVYRNFRKQRQFVINLAPGSRSLSLRQDKSHVSISNKSGSPKPKKPNLVELYEKARERASALNNKNI